MAMRNHADPNSPAAITDAKNAALGALLVPMNAQSLAISHFIRMQVIDQVIPNQQEANRVLAEELIQDILTKSRSNALGDNQITRDDLKYRGFIGPDWGFLEIGARGDDHVLLY